MLKRIFSIVALFGLVAVIAYADDRPLVIENGTVQQLPSGTTLTMEKQIVTGRSILDLFNAGTVNSFGLFTTHYIYNDWSPTNLATGTPLLVQASDDSGTTVTGLDSTGASVGDVHTICNMGGHEDASTVSLTNLDARSLAANRFLVPHGGDFAAATSANFKIGIDECATVTYSQPNYADATFHAWVVNDAHARMAQAVIEKLQLYPTMAPAALTGDVDDYDPVNAGSTVYTCTYSGGALNGTTTDCSIDGSMGTLRSTSVIYLSTNNSTTRTITGLKYTDGPTGDLGPVVILINGGPGAIKLTNGCGSSTSAAINTFCFDQTGAGTKADVYLNSGTPVILYHLRDAGYWMPLAKRDYYFGERNITVTAGSQFSGFDATTPIGAGWNTNMYAANTAAQAPSSTQQFIQVGGRDTAAYNLTSGGANVYGGFFTGNATLSAGANVLNNYGIYTTAALGANGGHGYALYTDAGDVYLNIGGGALLANGSLSIIAHTLDVGDGAQIINGKAPTSVNHGALSTGSTNWVGAVTGVGANTSVVLTFGSSPGFTRATCFATVNGSGTPEFIVVTNSASAPTFSCFNTTTGAAANCVDFSYQCVGQ